MDVLSDIEIARKNQMVPIEKVASKLKLEEDSLQKFGHHIAKIDTNTLKNQNKNGKLILVTAISPTPAGEGKTTTSVGLNDALNKIGKQSLVCLREPSLGPCLVLKEELLEVAMRKWSQWIRLIFILLVIFMQSHLLITCLLL